jgi:hypothetical protein
MNTASLLALIGLLTIVSASFIAALVMFRMSWLIPTSKEKCPHGRSCLLKNRVFLKSASAVVACVGLGSIGLVFLLLSESLFT